MDSRPDTAFALHVMIDLCVVPIGVGVSLSREIAECQRLIAAAGLKSSLHPYGTVIEGEWDSVMACVKACHLRLHALGVPRVFTSLKLGTRQDRVQTMEDKLASVAAHLAADPKIEG